MKVLSYLNVTADAEVNGELSFSSDWMGIIAHR